MTTATSTKLVLVSVVGERRKFPKCPDDAGLVGRLLEAIRDGSLPDPVKTLYSGGGMYEATFHPDDAPAIHAWLRVQGVAVEETDR